LKKTANPPLSLYSKDIAGVPLTWAGKSLKEILPQLKRQVDLAGGNLLQTLFLQRDCLFGH
jgi:hypothetical protein